jgi:hypothetical protein
MLVVPYRKAFKEVINLNVISNYLKDIKITEVAIEGLSVCKVKDVTEEIVSRNNIKLNKIV